MKLKVKLKFIILNILLLKNLTSESFARNCDIPVITVLIKELLQIKQEIQKLKLN